MVDYLDRKIIYWFVILIMCGSLFLGFLFFDGIEFLVVAVILFILYSYLSLHRCPSCSSLIFSWALRCDKCEKEVICYKKDKS